MGNLLHFPIVVVLRNEKEQKKEELNTHELIYLFIYITITNIEYDLPTLFLLV